MFCPKCGNQLGDGARFCANCGNQLSSGAETNATQPQYQPVETVAQPAPQKEKKSSAQKGKIAGIVLFVLGVLAFIGGASNGTLTDVSDISGVVSLLLKIGLVIGGGYLFFKNKDQ